MSGTTGQKPQPQIFTGMVSPQMPFVDVDSNGTLTPIAFRMLFELLRQVTDLQRRIDAAGIAP